MINVHIIFNQPVHPLTGEASFKEVKFTDVLSAQSKEHGLVVSFKDTPEVSYTYPWHTLGRVKVESYA